MGDSPLHDEGGTGQPILLLHGLMGRGQTWRNLVPWFRQFGHVYTYDAPGHGRAQIFPINTERIVDELADQISFFLEPAIAVGHSMGGLHAWVLAARWPDQVARMIIEDMAPDFRGYSVTNWSWLLSLWPQIFPSFEAMQKFFGPVGAEYFQDALDHGDNGWWIHGDPNYFTALAEEWGERGFWDYWQATTQPALLLEAEHSITGREQMQQMARSREHVFTQYVRILGTGHIIHQERPRLYRRHVRSFLDRGQDDMQF